MKISEDRLDILKAKYLGLIDDKKAEIAKLQQKLRLLDELREEAEGMNLFGSFIESSSPAKGDEKTNDHPFAATGLTESVLKSISWFGTKPFTPPVMRAHLLEGGFKPSGKNFDVSVGTTLKRLVAQGRLLKDNLNGKTVYRAKP